MNELLDTLMNEVFGDVPVATFYGNPTMSPRVDVTEDDKNYTLEMELPGRTEEDVSIELEEDSLTISSKKEVVKEEKDSKKSDKKEEKPAAHYLLKERYVSDFSRKFTLPKNVNPEQISASFKNGILTINMEKKAIEAPKRIQIMAG